MESVESRAVDIFIKSTIDQDLVHKLVVKTLQIIPCESEDINVINDKKRLPSLLKFLNKLIQSLNLNNGILMSTIVYLNRLKSKLPQNCKGLPSTRHRILLSCLILSIKFNNDFSLKNYDWLKLTNRLFNLKDINLMERQLLFLLNWNLFINEIELFNTFNKFLHPIKEKLLNNYRMKQYLSQQQQIHSPKKDSMPSSPTTPNSVLSSSHSPQSAGSSNSSSPVKKQFIPNQLNYYQAQPLSVNTRKSSNSSIASSYTTFSPTESPIHYRNASQSSLESLDSVPLEAIPTKICKLAVNPIIEMTALNEQYQLNKLLESFQQTTL